MPSYDPQYEVRKAVKRTVAELSKPVSKQRITLVDLFVFCYPTLVGEKN